MTPHETAGACIAVAIGLLLIAPAAFDRWHKPRTDRRFQRTARQAARTPRSEATVRRDLAKARAARERAERQAFNRIIDREFPKGIPAQTRRTEEDQ